MKIIVGKNRKPCHHGVILKLVTTNICGSDQHIYRGRFPAPEGMILVHENTGEVVEVGGQPLGHAARVAEHDRRSMGADQLQDPWVHVRPDTVVGLGIVESERVRGRDRRGGMRAALR